MNDPNPVDSEGVISFKDDDNQQCQDYAESEGGDTITSQEELRETTNTTGCGSARGLNEAVLRMNDMVSSMGGVLKDVVAALQSMKHPTERPQGSEPLLHTDQTTVRSHSPMRALHSNSNHSVQTQHDRQNNSTGMGAGDRDGATDARIRAHVHTDGRRVETGRHPSPHRVHQSRYPQWDDRRAYQAESRRFYSYDEHGRGSAPAARQAHVKIPSFNGNDDWSTWIARFESIAHRCMWTDGDKLDQLLPRLDGIAAEFVFSQLSPNVVDNYCELIAELNSRFRVVETARSFAAKFSRRTQKHGETAEDYAADLKRLYNKAHGYRDRITRDEDLVRHFLDGLYDEDVRLEVEFHKEPKNIDEAVYQVVNLVQLRNSCRGEKRNRNNIRRTQEPDYRNTTSGYDDREPERACVVNNSKPNSRTEGHRKERSWHQCDTATETEWKIWAEALTARIAKLEGERRNKSKVDVECYNCHKLGHYARECPDRINGNPRGTRMDQEGARQQPSPGNPLNCHGPTLAAEGRSQ